MIQWLSRIHILFEAMLQGEMNSHLGYPNNGRGEKETVNRRNGYSKKTLKTTVGDVPIEVPRDHEGTFEPVVIPKRKRDVSDIQDKVLSMYAKGMSQRDIAIHFLKLNRYEKFVKIPLTCCCSNNDELQFQRMQ